jgi:hypothetical protein
MTKLQSSLDAAIEMVRDLEEFKRSSSKEALRRQLGCGHRDGEGFGRVQKIQQQGGVPEAVRRGVRATLGRC